MNRRGYAGYEDAFELAGSKYHVRHRVLDAELGRWTRRDPLGYVDGMGLYEYVHSQALGRTDPSGLAWLSCQHPPYMCPGLIPNYPLINPYVITPVLIPVITPILPECTLVAGVGLVCCVTVGTVVTCSVIIAEELFPTPHYPPPSDPVPPTRTCPPEVERRLEQEVHNACDRPRTCQNFGAWPHRPGTPEFCDEVRTRIQRNRDCIEARVRITNECFGGRFDDTHFEQWAAAMQALDDCELLQSRYCHNIE
jgi:RHS repeat-associated protein